MSTHPIQWQAPQPLWGRFGADDQKRPAILRFATDDFMEQMIATVARDPARIDRLVARPESWRSPTAEGTDLVERTPLPLAVQGARRSLFARKPRAVIAPTGHEAVDPGAQGAVRKLPLKLYQPAHQRFYLVASSLVCAVPGLPERSVVPGDAEAVGFVIRRLLPAIPGGAGDLREFGFVKDVDGARWQRVSADADRGQAVVGEDVLPLFPLAYQDETARGRKLWAGFVPVGRREEYMGTTVDRTAAPSFATALRRGLGGVAAARPDSKLARVAQFQVDVSEPWKNLVRAALKFESSLARNVTIGSEKEPAPTPASPGKRKRVFDFNLAQQATSWLILLDFADYLSTHLPDVWDAIETGTGEATLSGHRKTLHHWLGQALMPAGLRNALKANDLDPQAPAAAASLRDALKAIREPGVREKLEAATLSYTASSKGDADAGWPPFHFVLAGVDTVGTAMGPYTALASLDADTGSEFVRDPGPDAFPAANDVDLLTALVGRALEPSAETNAPPVPFALQMKNAIAANIGDSGWFVVRFVYQRRDCGPLHPPVLSEPTQRFQLAGFFDPDAPARPIRISLPLDTSPAGLRKHNKNTAFVLSDMLCGQVQRAKGLGFIDLVLSVLPWPLHKDLDVGDGGPCKDGSLSIGMICSISIPIITICALIVLIIMVSLLDLVFRWLPFFVMCFPVPKFKGKP